jgi:hypothetical protein
MERQVQKVGRSVGEKDVVCVGAGADFFKPPKRAKMAALSKVCSKF